MESKYNELELMIKNITSEVVGAVLNQSDGQAPLRDLAAVKNKLLFVLIPELAGDLQKFIECINERYSGYELVFGTRGNIDLQGLKQVKETINIDDEPSRQRLNRMINKFDAACLILPEIMVLKAIAEGDDRDFTEKLIIYLVLHGKDTGIILDYDIESLPSSSLTRRLKELLVSIKSMGIFVSLLCSSHDEENIVTVQKGKRLITEKDVEEMFRNGINTLNIGNECIITPMAKDKANELKMKVN